MNRILLTLFVLAFGIDLAMAQAPTVLCLRTPVGNCVDVSASNPLPTGAAAAANAQSVPINIATAVTTQLVPIVAGAAIYVTSWDVIAGGTGNFRLVYGTGALCATGQVNLTGAYPLTAQNGIAKGSGAGAVLKVPVGNALCAITDAAVQMSGSVSYFQQ